MFWKKKPVVAKPLLSVLPVPDWTAEDAANWKRFLQTESGQAMWQRARAFETKLCVEACQGNGDPKIAGGVSNAFNWLENLISVASAAQEANSGDDGLGEPETADTQLTYD